MSQNTDKIISLYDGKLSAREVASILGLSSRYVRRIAQRHNLERLHVGAQPGKNNHRFVSGRRIDLDGYVLVTAPKDHPFQRLRKGRPGAGVIFEHRLVMERKMGRYLLPTEVVDHIDGLTLHNDPDNLRLFLSNGQHLQTTISGLPKNISASGKKNIASRYHRDGVLTPVDIYSLRRKRGDIRLLQILRTVLRFGMDSPFSLGTHRHLEKIGIDWSDGYNLALALDNLSERFLADLNL